MREYQDCIWLSDRLFKKLGAAVEAFLDTVPPHASRKLRAHRSIASLYKVRSRVCNNRVFCHIQERRAIAESFDLCSWFGSRE